VFAYFYFWTVSARWPPPPFDLPGTGTSIATAIAWIASAAMLAIAHRRLSANAGRAALIGLLTSAIVLMWAGFAFNFMTLGEANVRPDQHAYGAVIYTMLSWQGLHVVLVTLMGAYTIARVLAGMVDRIRRNTFDNTRLMGYYTIAQGLFALLVMHTPRVF
jgi:cytochrome c oxidase subunit I+III